MSPPRRLSVYHRPGRHSSATPGPAGGPRLLPGPWPPAPQAHGWEWPLGHRARQLYLDPATLTGDLARIGLPVPVNRLDAILAGGAAGVDVGAVPFGGDLDETGLPGCLTRPGTA